MPAYSAGPGPNRCINYRSDIDAVELIGFTLLMSFALVMHKLQRQQDERRAVQKQIKDIDGTVQVARHQHVQLFP